MTLMARTQRPTPYFPCGVGWAGLAELARIGLNPLRGLCFKGTLEVSSNKGKNTPPSRIRGVFEEETPLILLGGEGGIRTPDELTPITVFKTAAVNRSATPPICEY